MYGALVKYSENPGDTGLVNGTQPKSDEYTQEVKDKHQQILDSIAGYVEDHKITYEVFAQHAGVSEQVLYKFLGYLRKPGYFQYDYGRREHVFIANKSPRQSNVDKILDALKALPSIPVQVHVESENDSVPKDKGAHVVLHGHFNDDISLEIERLLDEPGQTLTLGRLMQQISATAQEKEDVVARNNRAPIIIDSEDDIGFVLDKINVCNINFSQNCIHAFALAQHCYPGELQESKIVLLSPHELVYEKGYTIDQYLTEEYLIEIAAQLQLNGRLVVCDAELAIRAFLKLHSRSKQGLSKPREYGKVVIPFKPLSKVVGGFTSSAFVLSSFEVDKGAKVSITDTDRSTLHGFRSVMLQLIDE